MKRKSKAKKKNQTIIRKCIECDYTKFHYDYKLHETSCLKCGLVLYAPYNADFIVDGFKFENVKKKNKKKN